MYVEKKNSPKQIFGKLRGLINPRNVMVKQISPSIKILRDVHIPTRDGSYLSANIYMPSQAGTFPALLSLHPARKDVLCKDGYMHIQFRFARQPGKINFSDETSFEAPIPTSGRRTAMSSSISTSGALGCHQKALHPRSSLIKTKLKTCTMRLSGQVSSHGRMAMSVC